MDLDRLKKDIKKGSLNIEDTAILREFRLGFQGNSGAMMCFAGCVISCTGGRSQGGNSWIYTDWFDDEDYDYDEDY